MQYTEKELAKLIEDVEREFTAHLSKSEESFKLAKSEDCEDKSEDKKKDKESKIEKSEDEEKKEDKSTDKDKEAKEAKEADEADEAKSKDEAEAHDDKSHDDDECHDYDDEDIEHMHKMYRSMSKGELKAHHDAIMKCIEEGKAPRGAKGPVSDASKEQDKIAKHGLSAEQIKAKLKKSDGSGGEISPSEPKGALGAKSPASEDQKNLSDMEKNMEKTEATELQLLKSENENLKKNFEAITEFLTKLVKKTAPEGKAITSLDVVAKSEGDGRKQLTKSEINAILLRKASDPSLQKSDREAINSYYLNGQVNVNSISHLLK